MTVKLLLDSCVWGLSAQALRDAGHDVIYAGEWEEDPGDEEILQRAHREQRILVTLDKDFGELAIVGATPHSGIIRLHGFPARRQADAIMRVINSHGDELTRGSIVTVQPGRIRIRPA